MKLLKYSNGVGHLVMSVVVFMGGLALVLWPPQWGVIDPSTKGIALGFCSTVVSSWFLPNVAKQFAYAVQKQTGISSPILPTPPAPDPTPTPPSAPAALAPPQEKAA